MKQAFAPNNLKLTAGESAIATLAAIVSVLLELEIWAMFIGWTAYFTRGLDAKNGVINLVCVIIGIALGYANAWLMSAILGRAPSLIELAAFIFGLAVILLSLRYMPVFNNMLAFFLGLVLWFASHHKPEPTAFFILVSAAALGTFAGWLVVSFGKFMRKSGGAH